MSWNLSTGLVTALAKGRPTAGTYINANTISFATDAINDSANGLGNFAVGDFITVVGPDNKNVRAKVLTSSAGSIGVDAGTFSVAVAGSNVFIGKLIGGSFSDILLNGTLHLFTGARPSSADDTETGTKLAELTLNGGAIVAGTSLNGVNLDVFDANNYLKRAIDPLTAAVEVWSGLGLAVGTAGWGRYYDNNITTGASTTAVRQDGTVSTVAGSDIVMANGRDIAVGAPVSTTDIAFSFV